MRITSIYLLFSRLSCRCTLRMRKAPYPRSSALSARAPTLSFGPDFPFAVNPHVSRAQHAVKHFERLMVLLHGGERRARIEPVGAVINVDFVPGRSRGDPRDIAWRVVRIPRQGNTGRALSRAALLLR